MADAVTTRTFRRKKAQGEKITVLTAYDFPTAQLVDEAGVDAILVGDSLGMAVMGLRDTLGVTMEHMLHHTRMVSRAVQRAMIIADMPFLSYQVDPQEALRNAGRLISEGGAHAVKLEGGADDFGPAIEAILRAGIPLMGHLGLTPQSVHQFGGYRVQGREEPDRRHIKEQALALQEAGCFAIVLECVPADLAHDITEVLEIPTIGIGAGADCDGQVLVCHDILGWGKTRFSKNFVDVRTHMRDAFEEYVKEVRGGAYPAPEHSYK